MGGGGKLVVALVLLRGAAASASEPGRVVPAPRFPLATERVQVDVVVRDKKGAILRGLLAADFEVYEDGVRQDVESLDLLERTPPPFVPADPDPSLAPAKTTPTFVAMAFDRLTPGARVFAQQALLRYLDGPLATKAWFGAFAIDHGLTTLQPFTYDNEILTAAIADFIEATSHGPETGVAAPDLNLSAMRAILWTDVEAHTPLIALFSKADFIR